MNPPLPPLVTRRTFVGQCAAGAAALTFAVHSRSQPATPRKLGVAIVGLGSYARGQIGPALKDRKSTRLNSSH